MRRRWAAVAMAAIAVVAVVVGVAVLDSTDHRRPEARTTGPPPLSPPTVRIDPRLSLPGEPPSIAWPSRGQSAIGVDGTGAFASAGSAGPVPIASLAKTMTALVVLRDHPLRPGEAGPTLVIEQDDVRRYQDGPRTRQSNLRVVPGERLSERQALDALLVPSANNIAFALARWDAGSTASFVDRMNALAAQLHLAGTHYTDPSGYDPTTVSTATDQVNLALVAMQDPTFAEIVAQRSVVLPLAGPLRNYNRLLGNETIGVKTGSTRPAGGCVVFAARLAIGGSDHLVVGAVLGQRGPELLPAALDAARALEQTALAAVRAVPLPAGTGVGVVGVGRAARTLTTGEEVQFLAWPGVSATLAFSPGHVGTRPEGGRVGTVRVRVGEHEVSTSLVAAGSVITTAAS